ncbi:MAG: hypothetical protein HQL76_16435 [Magnetococcales bacterium]|nr:hypothetical protein [Magnetococcales bacterium]
MNQDEKQEDRQQNAASAVQPPESAVPCPHCQGGWGHPAPYPHYPWGGGHHYDHPGWPHQPPIQQQPQFQGYAPNGYAPFSHGPHGYPYHQHPFHQQMPPPPSQPLPNPEPSRPQTPRGGGNGGLSSLLTSPFATLKDMLDLDDQEFWKGALVGVAAVLLLSGQSGGDAEPLPRDGEK